MATSNVLIITLLAILCYGKNQVVGADFPAIFSFGDSTMDTGNNNYFNTIAKANFRPYGKDFPGKVSTGRFSNGKLIPDLLASSLGLKHLLPPFLEKNLSDSELVTGVNFASAASGIDDKTDSDFGIIPVSKQIDDLFRNYTTRLKKIVGEKNATNIISSGLVVFSAGSNDALGNTNTSYQDFLIHKIQIYVEELYDMGCRRMLVAGLPPLGCLPIQMTNQLEISQIKKRKCLNSQNLYAQSYNQKLVSLLPHIQARLPRLKLAYVDVYKQLMGMIQYPQLYGFTKTTTGCCGSGYFERGILCNPIVNTLTCSNSSEYIFFDAIHPTEAAYKFITHYILKHVLPQLL